MQLAIFCKYICLHGFDRSFDTILLRNYQIIIWLKIESQRKADGYVSWKLVRLRAKLSFDYYNLALVKTTRTPRVHLIYTSAKDYNSYLVIIFFHCCSHCVRHGVFTLIFISNIN